ncbi:glycosyltransferase [Blautia sp. AM16-16B]|nr:glycosyltransferase [Blautia sp. AM16-16B]
MPQISIIIPVYDVEKYLERCIESVLNQTLKDIEIILVDDGSPDRSGKMCDVFAEKDKRIKVIHKENGGLSSARNAGISMAKGKYIGFVDSDDWIEDDMFEYLFNLIEQYDADIADCGMVETAKYEFVKDNGEENIEVLNRDGALDVFFRISRSDINYCACDKLYKRELVEKVQFTDGIIFEDIDFNYRVLIEAKKVVISDSKKYYYFKNPVGISRNSFREKDLELQKVWDNIIELSEIYTPDYVEAAKFNKKRADFGLLCKMFKYGVRCDNGDYELIRKNLLQSVRHNYLILIRGKLPLNRKVLLTAMCINRYLVEFPLKIRRRMIKKYE